MAPVITKISLFENIQGVTPNTREVTWEEITLAFAQHDHSKATKMEAGAYCPAEFYAGTSRAKANVERVHFGVLDIDKKPTDQVVRLLERLHRENRAFLFYTTWSHAEYVHDDKTCGRLLFPFDEPVEAHEWPDVWKRLHAEADYLGDPQCKDASRVYFVPSAPPGTEDDAVVDSNVNGEPFYIHGSITEPAPLEARVTVRPIRIKDLQATLAALKNARTTVKVWFREKLTALLQGESLADQGERDTVLWKLACLILDEYPQADPAQLAQHFAASLQIMATEAPGCPTVSNIEDKIRRKQQEKAEESVAREVSAIDDRKRQIRMAFDLQDRDYPYTTEELQGFARELGVNTRDLQHFWIVQKNTAYYVFVNGTYRGPFTFMEVEKAAQQYLAPAYSAGVELHAVNVRGELVAKSAQVLMRDYGTLASGVDIDMAAQKTHYDRMRRVMVEAPCPMRVHEARFSPEVDHWLKLMGGDHAAKLIDWLSVVTNISEPCAAVYFEGVKGAGKSLFAEGVARLWSTDGAVPLSDAFATFNSMTIANPIIFADEAMPKDFRGQTRTGELRQFIQARQRTLRRKFLGDAVSKGCHRLVLAANNSSLISSNEQLTVDDIDAIVDRIIHIVATKPAATYLASLPRDVVRSFVYDDVIAKHALWLRDNHHAVSDGRFLVTGDRTKLHRRLSTSSGIRSAMCNWLVAYLLDPQKIDHKRKLKVRVLDGKLLVNVQAPAEHWQVYPTNVDPPGVGVLAQALSGLSTGDKCQHYDGDNTRTSYWCIDAEYLVAWGEEHRFCSREDIETALQRTTGKTK